MLTIQPKITQYSNYSQRNTSFKGSDEPDYEAKTKFYENQTKELDELIKDNKTPKTCKKFLKVFKVASEALFDGWAVAWGAKKGSNIVKSSVISGLNSKYVAKAKKFIAPLFSKIKKSVPEMFEKLSNGIKNSEWFTKLGEKSAVIAEKMSNHPVGKYIVKGLKYIGEGFKYVKRLASDGLNKLITPIKNADASKVYDKAAKVTYTTLGVGAGTAGAYNAATRDSRQQMAQKLEDIE